MELHINKYEIERRSVCFSDKLPNLKWQGAEIHMLPGNNSWLVFDLHSVLKNLLIRTNLTFWFCVILTHFQ
jgi:hypothetical protein